MAMLSLPIISPAFAHDVAPHVEVGGGLLKMSLEECMRSAKETADKTGYTSNQESAINAELKEGDFYGWNPDFPYSVHVNCDAREGVWSPGVGATDRRGALLKWMEYYLQFQ